MTLNELKQFFDTYDKVESRIKEVAPLCTDICSCEEITGFSDCGDGDICVRVWSQDCGNDAYYFPLEYLSMTDDEIAESERKKEEKRRRLAEEEERKGGRLLISGRAIVDGKTAVFMVSRKVPLEQKPKVSPIKLIRFEELSNFDMKGKTK